jgi:c-di-GMP-binding flagellar brake protein YcgR
MNFKEAGKGKVMGAGPSVERRQHQRHPLATGVQFYHGPTQREFPARCVDISAGGMLMYVPVTIPVQPGQPIRLTVGGGTRPEFAVMTERPLNATIVRVDRRKLLSAGHIAVGVKFAEA